MRNTLGFLAVALLPGLGGCFEDQAPPAQAAYANLAFACRHESDNLPGVDQEADRLYRYGLFIERRSGPKDFDAAARYYRISAALGHYKANGRLQDLVSQGMAASPDAPRETIALARQLIDQGVPGGYYDMGHYLSLGYGIEQNEEKARIYMRKAADLGSPDAQYYVAELLGRVVGPKDVMLQMRRCAMEQGHGKAASDLAGYLQELKDYPTAVLALHKGVMSGNVASARRIAKAFEGPSAEEELYYLGLPKDDERAHRYHAIEKFLGRYEYESPKIPDIDQIVPLPPAKLPDWDGTFQWLKEREAVGDPEKPSEELLERLAREKQLDPKTGLPLSGEFSSQW
ncbi:hypothetical protein Pssp01_57140 [Pseudomonas sp. NBRC 100443]|nr:hypothetical protein Pssp01_57140 [Pseudomonas sp. NBRC 100443]